MILIVEGNEVLFCFVEDWFFSLFWRKSYFWFNEVLFVFYLLVFVKKILFCFFFNLFFMKFV